MFYPCSTQSDNPSHSMSAASAGSRVLRANNRPSATPAAPATPPRPLEAPLAPATANFGSAGEGRPEVRPEPGSDWRNPYKESYIRWWVITYITICYMTIGYKGYNLLYNHLLEYPPVNFWYPTRSSSVDSRISNLVVGYIMIPSGYDWHSHGKWSIYSWWT